MAKLLHPAVARVGNSGSYLLCATSATKLQLTYWSDKTNQGKTLCEHVLPVALQPGQGYEVELRVVGQTLTAKFNGVVFGSATDAAASEATLALARACRVAT